jgi:hypothetical protein
MKPPVLALLLLFATSTTLPAQVLVHYWNFNDASSQAAQLTPSFSAVGNAEMAHIPGGSSAIQMTSNTGQGFDVENLNARNGDPAGTHLRFNNPIGGGILFAIPTTGYQQVVVRYATRRSGSGAGIQLIDYTTDGINFTNYGSILPVDGNPTLQTLDFSGIPAVSDNPTFAVRITFDVGSGGSVGNNRFDNLTVEGNPLGADNIPPQVAFNPVNGAVNIPVSVRPALTFNEDIRRISDAPIADGDIPSLVALRLGGIQGADVPFTGSIDGRVITITPAAPLVNGQTYYVAVLPNTIEDLSDNAITDEPSAVFTVVVPQTAFSPGDLLPVAYRMNANGTPDEVAFLTLVNILPGTRIQMTDAKFTDNPQPQCPGGFTWISPMQILPSGTVITVQNDAGTASAGTVEGSTFGLSSSGDQMIVYTGTAADPSYVTALSSNDWVAGALTACGGSLSKRPASLQDGISCISLSTAPGQIGGNTVNAYYAGQQTGTDAELKAAILNPDNWIGVGSGTPAQVWPGWAFPGPPQVVEAQVTGVQTIELRFSGALDPVSATEKANYTGLGILDSAVLLEPSRVRLHPAAPFNAGQPYALVVRDIRDAEGRMMIEPYTFSFTYTTRVSFANRFVSVREDAGIATIRLNIDNPAPGATVDLVIRAGAFSTADLNDVAFNQTNTLSLGGSTTLEVNIPVVNDQLDEQDEYLVFALENAVGTAIQGNPFFTVYIRDNDRQAPSPTKALALEFAGRYTVPNPGNAEGLAEVVAYDPVTQRLFTISTGLEALDIIDFKYPGNPIQIKQVPLSAFGSGVTSVAVQNGLVVVTTTGVPTEQDNGKAVFFSTDGDLINHVEVGALPDMVVFTPDGRYVLTANEGQPNDAYTIDPEGSISIIDISKGAANVTQTDVVEVDFKAFNSQLDDLKASGVRITFAGSTVAQDMEPEFITVSGDSKQAWVTLQENNAIAELDLVTKTATRIWAMGTKDYSRFGSGLDLSDQSGNIHIANYPLKGFFIPDAVAQYVVNGTTYLVTANEGDEKEYAGLNERTTVSAVTLDSVAFPNAQVLRENHNMGRMRISNLHGDTDGDGDYDELYCLGSRSFSIWNSQTGALVYDSGDDFERITASNPFTAPIFNADNGGNGFKGRSRAKGPEPEGVALASIQGKTYAFVTLERIGGVMVYDISDPAAPVFVDYANTRDNTAFGGDNGPEGVLYISRADSPDGEAYVVSANEVSGTLAIFRLDGVPLNTADAAAHAPQVLVYPNPTTGRFHIDVSNLEGQVLAEVFDLAGKRIWVTEGAPSGDGIRLDVNLSGQPSGNYLLRVTTGSRTHTSRVQIH